MNPLLTAIAGLAVTFAYIAIIDAVLPAPATPARDSLAEIDATDARILILEAELAAREAELDQLAAALASAKSGN